MSVQELMGEGGLPKELAKRVYSMRALRATRMDPNQVWKGRRRRRSGGGGGGDNGSISLVIVTQQQNLLKLTTFTPLPPPPSSSSLLPIRLPGCTRVI